MANYYVRSGAAGAGTGADWANAYTTLTAALSGKTASDTLWVADDHAESAGAAITLTCPTSQGLRILGVNTHATEPPTALASTPSATVSVGAVSNGLGIHGFAYIEGIIFQGATNNSATATINLGSAATGHSLYFKNCKFNLRTASATALTAIGITASSTAKDTLVVLEDCSFKFAATGQLIRLGAGKFLLKNISLDNTGSTPTTLFTFNAASNGEVIIEGSDLSGVSPTNLFNYSATTTSIARVIDCKLPSGITIVTGTSPGNGGPEIEIINSDSTDTNYRYERYNYMGSVRNETTIVRSGGASDGTTTISDKMVSSANTSYPSSLLCTRDIYIWNDTVGSSVTATIEIVHDSQGTGTSSRFKDNEIWMEAVYLGTSGVPRGSMIKDAAADVFATAADQTDSSETWTTTGLTTPLKQKLSVTFTPQEKGYVICRVCLAKASATVYVCPKVTLT